MTPHVWRLSSASYTAPILKDRKAVFECERCGQRETLHLAYTVRDVEELTEYQDCDDYLIRKVTES